MTGDVSGSGKSWVALGNQPRVIKDFFRRRDQKRVDGLFVRIVCDEIVVAGDFCF